MSFGQANQKNDPASLEATRHDLQCLLGGYHPSSFSIVDQRRVEASSTSVRIERLNLVRGDGARVRAFLSGPPAPWHNRPAVLYCHAHGHRYDIGAEELIAGRPALLQPPYAQDLAAAGCVALCIDLPCFGERAGDTESAMAKQYLWHGRTLFGAMLEDLAGALDLLSCLGGVDPARISAFGISMGATLAFWLAAIDTRVAAVTHLCSFADLETLVALKQHDLHGNYMTVPGLLPRIRTGEIAGLIAPRPQVIGVGLADPLTPPLAFERALADVSAAYARAEATSQLTIITTQTGGHSETAEMRQASLAMAGQPKRLHGS